MKHALELTLQPSPEVLERVLRVMRHRGFSVTNMQMQINEDACIALAVEVETERAIELLSNQLDKLYDVAECRLMPAPFALNSALVTQALAANA
ncbi:acetolactate synthase 2 small subunit [Shewanella sp.]|uniref:acetolactate synthase 2 small subunit n=1 Tax=Shewanella sp. TaxID=50422 RepID=UPI0040538AE5